MENRLEAYAHMAGQTLRTGWYATLLRLTNREVSRRGQDHVKPVVTKPVPSQWTLLQDVLKLQAQDAKNVKDGIYPLPVEEDGSVREHLAAVRQMLADVPKSNERRLEGRGTEAAALPEAEGMPDYYAQNFHFQSGGWLTAESAKIYDVQVETLFMGTAGAMRRQAIRPIAEHIRGQDQRTLKLVDIACGTGRFLGQLAQAFPVMHMTGVDLSQPYLDEAARNLKSRRTISFRHANVEALPFESGTQDVVTCVYLYHELPAGVRRQVTTEIARVLKPGGLFVFVDSLQFGDVEGYDGFLEAFPQRFHEPYYMNYVEDRLEGHDGLFASAGLLPVQSYPAFMSKVVVCRKTMQ